MKTLGVILTLAVAGLAAAVVARPSSTAGTLQATVGPGYTITLTQDGSKVTQLDPGTYTIDVSDQSSIHDFHLTGPGVDESTDIEGTGTTTWTVTFQAGTYTFRCDAHPTTMNGTFTVGAAAPTTTAVGPPQAAPIKLRIVAARVVKPRTVRVTVTASHVAIVSTTLWKGRTRLAAAKATGTKLTVRLVARHALRRGVYVVRAAAGTARVTRTVVVR